ncbi:ATP-binding protein [Lacihabitans sp. CS3-21]|jgi:hypothetical protein|uniref:ATP-binding protein n=1 Tax=Lacihabitans sp. CS3-21 TaxID=2487332 RepID=UPI0020CCC5BF|nr:ATP-binding protein [Lacihabitans sp. CS3-21]MCP9746416.1 hypothetical protein [Lacihabitans sp. CS3-21]
MRALRLAGMADRYEAFNFVPQHQRLQTDVFLAQFLEAEELYRIHRRNKFFIKNNKFRYQANLQEINFIEGRILKKETISAFSECRFIDRGENIIITVSTGV